MSDLDSGNSKKSGLPGRARPGGRLAIIEGAVVFLGVFVSTCAHAIVSDRHLQGVSALECELESSPSIFTLLVDARKNTLQLENKTEKIAYEEVSEHVMRFPLALPATPVQVCEIEFPAGSLVCTREGGEADLGFCLSIMK